MKFFQFEDFAPLLNETFSVQVGDASMDMTMTAVERLADRRVPGQVRAPFRLLFRSASPIIVPQRLYPFSGTALGTLEIFIVPIGRDPQGIVYEAIFN